MNLGYTFSSGKLEFFSSSVLSDFALFSEISSEANKVDVFLDVVHDFGFKESLEKVKLI